jgi:hypothetical protein
MIEATPGTQERLNSAKMDARNGCHAGVDRLLNRAQLSDSATPSAELELSNIVSLTNWQPHAYCNVSSGLLRAIAYQRDPRPYIHSVPSGNNRAIRRLQRRRRVEIF